MLTGVDSLRHDGLLIRYDSAGLIGMHRIFEIKEAAGNIGINLRPDMILSAAKDADEDVSSLCFPEFQNVPISAEESQGRDSVKA